MSKKFIFSLVGLLILGAFILLLVSCGGGNNNNSSIILQPQITHKVTARSSGTTSMVQILSSTLPRESTLTQTLIPFPIEGSTPIQTDGSVEILIPLTWIGRSTEVAASVPFCYSPGCAVASGLALPLDPAQIIFDNGIYRGIIPSPGKEFTSWLQYHGGCFGTYEVRRFRSTFTLPDNLGKVFDLYLYAPLYKEYGNIIPINDNIYVYLNGIFIGKKGTLYGAILDTKAPWAIETDGWYQGGSFGPASVTPLKPGVNIIDIVAEEFCYYGGMSRLDLKLIVEKPPVPVIEVPIDIKPQSCPNPLNVNAHGILPAAILGTVDFDVNKIDLASIKLEGISPARSALEDVATPFVPFIGRKTTSDCTVEGPDGFLDLTLKFNNQDIVGAIGMVSDGEILVLKLSGNLKKEFGASPIVGEDIVVIIKKKI